jgi:DNA-3-methyladenine glycosylase II
MARSSRPAKRWAEALVHLEKADPRLGPLMKRVGPCSLRPARDRFETLVRAIASQQISTKAAAAILARLKAQAGDPIEPEPLLGLGLAGLRAVGLSGQKAGYMLGLAEAVSDGTLPLRKIGTLADEEIVERLTAVKGIGRWTAEMFLIFGLNRADVLPIHDYGIRVAIRNHFNLDAIPTPSACVPLAELWRPYRSIAMWYLWRSLDTSKPPA